MLSSALFVAMLIMGFGLYSLHCRQRLRHYQQMAGGVQYINHIEKVLEHLPQHRGMANTVLNGDNSFLEKMKGLQQILAQDITTLDQYSDHHKIHSELQTRWQGIKSGWNTLKNELQSLSAGESFERHSLLIGEVLYLISDAADRMSLTNHPDPSVRQIIKTTFNLLPPIVENIGQARGIGSGAAAKGTLLTAIRIKLEFLHERLNSNADTAYSTIAHCIQQNNGCNISSDAIDNSQRQTRHFLKTVSTHLLSDKITISATDYFSEGTTAFNSNLALLDNITSTLGQQIDNMMPRLKSHFVWSITVAVGGAILLILIWWNLALR